MKILALDASTEALSVAVVDVERDYELEHFEIAPQAHARRLLPLARELLERADLELADLDGLAFGRGPDAASLSDFLCALLSDHSHGVRANRTQSASGAKGPHEESLYDREVQ